MNAREISEAVQAALTRDPADVLYVHSETGEPIAAIIPIRAWNRELSRPIPEPHIPFETYSHGHIAPEDDDE